MKHRLRLSAAAPEKGHDAVRPGRIVFSMALLAVVFGGISGGQGAVNEVSRDSESIRRHWAFVAPVRPAAPAVLDESWVRNEIDRFVASRLEKEGLAPQREADRHTLARRLHLDLTGLPPTWEEVQAFVNDASPNAYEKRVDRLLASPHYGEHMARGWLDLARYADSNGYQVDLARSLPEQLSEITTRFEERYLRKALRKTRGHVGKCAR